MRKRIILVTAILALALMAMCACSKTSLVMNGTSDKNMTVEAEKAGKGEFAMVGSLEVVDGEQVVMTSNLEKGGILIELFGTSAEQSEEELPDVEGGDPVMTFNASGTDSISGTLPAGSYMVKATVTEKATGYVQIDVTEAK